MGTLLLVAFLMAPTPPGEGHRERNVGRSAILALSSDLVRWCREMKLRWAETYQLQAQPLDGDGDGDGDGDCQIWIETCEGKSLDHEGGKK